MKTIELDNIEIAELTQRIAELEEELKKTNESYMYWFSQYNNERAKYESLIKGVDGLIFLAKQNNSFS